MTRPDLIRIAGLDFTVHTEASEDFTDHLGGQIDYRKRHIRLSDWVDVEQQREILLHEVVHGIDSAYGGKLTERQVSVLSRGLFAVLVDNPLFALFLVGHATRLN